MGQKNVSSGVEFQPYKNSQKHTDRLSAQERENVAEQLMSRTAIGRDYVNDIVQTVADMIPDLDENRRVHFIEKLFRFIHEANGYQGEKTYSFLNQEFLGRLTEYDRQNVLDELFDELSRSHVLACEAKLWGIAHVLPAMPQAIRSEKIDAILKIAEDGSWHETLQKVFQRLVGRLIPEERTDFVYKMTSYLKKNVAREIKKFVLMLSVQTLAQLPENDRSMIADTIAPQVFDTDLNMVRLTLGFFENNISLLPTSQRYPYALMMAGLLHDISLQSDVQQTLSKVLRSLLDPSEKAHIVELIGLQPPAPTDGFGEFIPSQAQVTI